MLLHKRLNMSFRMLDIEVIVFLCEATFFQSKLRQFTYLARFISPPPSRGYNVPVNAFILLFVMVRSTF